MSGYDVLDDSVKGTSMVCCFCKHWLRHSRRCTAFDDLIPLEIWHAKNHHMRPYPGDNGLRFEWTDRLPAPNKSTDSVYLLWLEGSTRDMDDQMRDAGYEPEGGT